MDFIEQIFGFSPDGGSGSFELLLFLIPLIGIAVLWWRRSRRRGESLRTRPETKKPAAPDLRSRRDEP